MIINILVTKRDVGFRECANIKHIADENHCTITISANGKEGTNKSILSLASMGIKANSIIVLKAANGKELDTFRGIYHLLKDSDY